MIRLFGMAVHLSASSLSKSFDGVHQILDGLKLRVERGEFVFLVGGSGSGKTTLLRLLAGLDQPTAGQVMLDDVCLSRRNEQELLSLRRRIGVVFQGAALFDDMQVWENLALPLREHSDHSERRNSERIAELLEELGLTGSEHKLPAQLSGGMKKRVGLARALMLKPEVILYDEPTGGLDAATARHVERLMWRVCRDEGVTSVAVSHDMASALRLADRICVLEGGSIVQEGTPDAAVHDEPLARLVRDSGVDTGGLLDSRGR